MKGYTIMCIDGHDFVIWKARLRDEMPHADHEFGNPTLWWAMDLENRNMIVCGYKLKRDALKEINEYLIGDK